MDYIRILGGLVLALRLCRTHRRPASQIMRLSLSGPSS